jgi:hypothetical protein
MRPKNIYYRIVKNEDSFTEAFVNSLSDNRLLEQFKTLLQRELRLPTLDFVFDDLTTQSTGDDGSRPDIAVETPSLSLFIESKISPYTDLTENQPQGYLHRLASHRNTTVRALVFVVPKQYRHTSKLLELYRSTPTDIKSASLFTVLYWEDVISALEGITNEKWFSDFVTISREILDYRIQSMDNKDIERLTAGGSSFVKLLLTIENTKKLLEAEGYRIEEEANPYSYGYHIRAKEDGRYLLYFGILYSQWANEREPLYFGFDDREYDQRVARHVRATNGDLRKDIEDGWEYGCLELSTIADSPDPAAVLISKLKGFLNS